jgi:hypothetical protein
MGIVFMLADTYRLPVIVLTLVSNLLQSTEKYKWYPQVYLTLGKWIKRLIAKILKYPFKLCSQVRYFWTWISDCLDSF